MNYIILSIAFYKFQVMSCCYEIIFQYGYDGYGHTTVALSFLVVVPCKKIVYHLICREKRDKSLIHQMKIKRITVKFTKKITGEFIPGNVYRS